MFTNLTYVDDLTMQKSFLHILNFFEKVALIRHAPQITCLDTILVFRRCDALSWFFFYIFFKSANSLSLENYLHICYTNLLIREEVRISPKFLLTQLAIQRKPHCSLCLSYECSSVLLISRDFLLSPRLSLGRTSFVPYPKCIGYMMGPKQQIDKWSKPM